MQTRKDKINFLMGLSKGKRRIDELVEQSYQFVVMKTGEDGTERYYQYGVELTPEQRAMITKNTTVIKVTWTIPGTAD